MPDDTTLLDAPVASSEPDDFDFATLDPANLLKAAVGEQVEIPQTTPVDGGTTPAAAEGTPAAPTQVTPTTPAEPSKPEGVNMRKLRELREEAEKRATELAEQNKTLAERLADLEPRAKSFESEKERLEQELRANTEAMQNVQAMAGRAAARERADWREKADAIRAAAKSVEDIASLPELREAGVAHPVVTLLDPAARSALNDVIRVLNENGKYSEAQDLIDNHRAVNAWRGELRRIEDAAAEEATAWQTRREETALGVVRGVREELARANPVHDTRSPEFLALPQEQRDFLAGQHAAAEQAAREVLSRIARPQELVAETYRTQLGLRLFQQANAGMSAQLGAAQKELAEVKARLDAYEKAAGGGGAAASSGGGGQRAGSDPDDPSELARMLDPRNLNGYRGL
jgi:hypothetical protein